MIQKSALVDCRYATACARSDGLLLLSGGRDAGSVVCSNNLSDKDHTELIATRENSAVMRLMDPF
jgi:hypothetical protein